MIKNNFKDKYFELLGDEEITSYQRKTKHEKQKSKEEKLIRALNRAHELRKFEIENYWKRATYFWSFQLVAFTAIGFLIGSLKEATPEENLIWLGIIPCLIGLVTARAGLLAAIGSKFWQENWEGHVYFLEDAIEGNLNKTIIVRSRISYSVSKINEILYEFLFMFWLLVSIWVIAKYVFSIECLPFLKKTCVEEIDLYLIPIFAIISCIILGIYAIYKLNTKAISGLDGEEYIKNSKGEISKYNRNKREKFNSHKEIINLKSPLD